ncbi:MAG: bifunctional demethylmenaquinone methyltransferase/2-methoxy-6-polyprenyl-1,4-benzoquinol methylase UbiE [Acidobacteriota bacterium]
MSMETQASNLGPSSKALRVRSMFAEIAPRYDFLNHALSLNIDKRWRRLVIKTVAGRLRLPGAMALDLCCGTADLSLELGALAPTFGVDFCHPMLQIGAKKVRRAALPIELIEGDALSVPFADSLFDVVTVAFGLRNLDDPESGLREIYRLVKPGGRCVVLEFSHPHLPVFRNLFHFYFTRLLPLIGSAVSGSRFAYQYLPDSVQKFPGQKELAAMMEAVGFSDISYYNLFGGVASLHLGEK